MGTKGKKNRLLPRSLVKNLSEDIGLFMENKPFGWLQALELFDQTPMEMRGLLLEELSAYHSRAVLDFFSLLKLEYGSELEEVLDRLMRKFAMVGLEPGPLVEPLPFYGAYACCTRHSGDVCVDVAWWLGNGRVKVDSMLLCFHGDGLGSVLPMEQSVTRFNRDRTAVGEMIPVSLEEVCVMVKDAYACNQRFVTRPALGRFIYQKYLDHAEEISPEDKRRLLRRLSISLTPRQLVNSLFRAIRGQDEPFIDALLTPNCDWSRCPNLRPEQHADGSVTLLEGRVEAAQGTLKQMEVTACALSLHEDMLCRTQLRYTLIYEHGLWYIDAVEETGHEYIDEIHSDNPLNVKVYCKVYSILDIDDLFDIIDGIENIRQMEELPYGVHLRIEENDDDFNFGMQLMSGVFADLVVNADEFVVMSPDAEIAEGIKNFLHVHCEGMLQLCGDYEVALSAVHDYLNGKYIYFEEMFSAEDGQQLYEDGLCLISTRYFVRDRAEVVRRLHEMGCVLILERDDCQVYYQLDQRQGQSAMLAEYILWPSWMTLSAFGDQDLQKIRCGFEKDMFSAIEFDGIEIREDGIFDILSSEVRREHPQLEQRLKEIYLNKWYFSRLGVLSGMSPSEACQTEEGTRLLWAMFQKIKQRDKRAYLNGERTYLDLKDYMRRTDMRK
ncbi:MAG: hypothetical protein Q4B48_00385 [Syntrophomonadaceae bacterium]|nr:hypothetical protein [Syntrophomonadaceae bacterium]